MSLSKYLQSAHAQATELALKLHSEEVTLEHLACALLSDEESAICELVEHAFADPETLYEDALALTPGILVVGSGATRPFSVRAVEASRRAVELAQAAGLAMVTPACLLSAAYESLSPEAVRALSEAGCNGDVSVSGGEAGSLSPGTHLFHPFDDVARRALTSASRQVKSGNRRAISPADLIIGALKEDSELARAFGTNSSGANALLGPFSSDETPPPARHVPDDAALTEVLSALPEEAGSLALLQLILKDSEAELAQVFLRQKVTSALLERSLTTFVDP